MLDCLKPALLATGLTLTMATAPHAAVMSFDLEVSFVNGPLLGSLYDPFLLTIFYDDDSLTYGDVNDGDGNLSPSEGLGIVFNSVNVRNLDTGYPNFPQVGFEDHIPVTITFLINSFTVPELLGLGILEMAIGYDYETDDYLELVYDPATARYSTGASVIMAPIPLPAGLPLLAGGLGLMALAARRRTRG